MSSIFFIDKAFPSISKLIFFSQSVYGEGVDGTLTGFK